MIFGVIAILVIAGILFVISNRPQGDLKEPEPQFVIAPSVDVEATVTSLYLDDLHEDCEEPEVCPRDRVTLRIDKIDKTGDPNDVMRLDVGDEFELYLKYSARPAKLRGDILPTCRAGEVFKLGSCVSEGCEGPECLVTSPSYEEKPAEMENGYIIYHLPKREDTVTEKILPGLQENSKIKIKIWEPNFISNEIGEYELIS